MQTSGSALLANLRDMVRRLLSTLRYVRLRPFDVATETGRSQERHRRLALSAAASGAAKLISVLTALISLPLTLTYLGPERFGMWATISSMIAMMAFVDFGIGNGVLSAVASAHGRGDLAATRRAVSTGFYLLIGVGMALALAFILVSPFVSWHSFFNVESAQAQLEAGPAAAVFVLCFAANIPLSVVQRVQMGLQQSFLASIWQCVGSLLALVGVLCVIHLGGPLPWLVLALAGAPLLASIFNSCLFYLHQRPDLRPRLKEFSVESVSHIASMGAMFFTLQVVVTMAYASDSFIIARLLGASAVTHFAVPEKLFGLIALIVAMVTAPLWPAYGEAIARGDRQWVVSTLTRSTVTVVSVAAVLSTLFILFGKPILSAWVGSAVAPSWLLLFGLGVWKVVEAWGGAVAVFLNGTQSLTLQVLTAIPTALCAVALKILLVPQLGVAGAVWASIIAYGIFSMLPLMVLLPKIKQQFVGSTSGRPS